eukprot:1137446-Pelagomonas_calceolata.AAC.20
MSPVSVLITEAHGIAPKKEPNSLPGALRACAVYLRPHWPLTPASAAGWRPPTRRPLAAVAVAAGRWAGQLRCTVNMQMHVFLAEDLPLCVCVCVCVCVRARVRMCIPGRCMHSEQQPATDQGHYNPKRSGQRKLNLPSRSYRHHTSCFECRHPVLNKKQHSSCPHKQAHMQRTRVLRRAYLRLWRSRLSMW